LLDDDLASAPVPGIEVADAASAPEALPPLMRRITLPVRYTQSEFDTSLSDPETLAFARDCLSASRGAQVRFEPDCGHNISLHQVAGAFHAGMLDFFEPLAR